LPRDRAEEVACEVLEHATGEHGTLLLGLIANTCDFAWSRSLSSAMLRLLRKNLQSADVGQGYVLRPAIGAMSLHCDHTLANSASEGWPENFPHQKLVDELVDTLRFRRDMLAALQSSAQ
jgi:hypothetical protein